MCAEFCVPLIWKMKGAVRCGPPCALDSYVVQVVQY